MLPPMASLDIGRALSFGSVAEEYARWRPTYPDEAIDFLSPRPPARVVDLGAGTGQLTGALLARGLDVDAIDPDPEMMRVLVDTHPAANAQLARADALPVATSTVDAVLVATAFHWFPFEETVAELRRVLKPGGWLGIVYNLVAPVSDWERELAAIDPDQKGLTPAPAWPFPSGEVSIRRFPWDWHVSPEHVRNCLATHSAVIRLPEADRHARLDAAEAILRRTCAEADSPTAPIHHEAFCLKWCPEPRVA
jgi:SAM-dependent methyltransferase